MTAVDPPISIPRLAPGSGTRSIVRSIVRGSENEAAWVRPALFAVLAFAAVLYVWNLTVSGYANEYYSAAALAGSQSWSAWFFGSFDANNFITVDKPPFGTMLMGLSVRLFGLSSWSILLPEAMCGVATVGVLFLAVKKSFGPAAATIAAVAMALTPAAVLIFRFNNPDGLLTLLLVVSAWALLHAVEKGSYRWMILSASLVGAAFLTKYLQAYLVLPAFALVFGFSADTTLRRRIAGLGIALATVLVTSGWWVAVVELLPADMRPFIGGSTTGSPLDLIFGYDGLGRIFGASGPGGGGPGGFGGGFGFSGDVGLFRLFNSQMFGEIAWLIPPAVLALVVGLYRRRWAHRTDVGLAGYLLWGGWFLVTALVFSYMSGIIHSYYAVALAPAVAALVGAGLVDLWRTRILSDGRLWTGGVAVGVLGVGTAWFGATLLDRTPDFAPGLGVAAIVVAAAALAILVVAAIPAIAARPAVRRVAVAAGGLAVVAMLLAPAAYAWQTMNTGYNGGDPHPGPATANAFGGGFGGFGGVTVISKSGTTTVPDGGFPGGGFGGPGGGFPGLDGGGRGGPGGPGGGAANATLIDYLVANRGDARWIVAVNGSGSAGQIELATGLPVMAMGGFTGSDPWPSLEQLQRYVADGELRFVVVGGGFGGGIGGFGGSSSAVESWVSTSCTAVTSVSSSLYDCSGAA
jgi:4-amino-4-deoxy-L-arabinose transferase-like glycosyltransferase